MENSLDLKDRIRKLVSVLGLTFMVLFHGKYAQSQTGVCFSSFQDNLFNSGINNMSQATGDLNGDSYLDMVFASQTGSISVMLGNGGQFSTPVIIYVGGYPVSPILADFNNDAKQDLVFGDYFANTVTLMLGTGTGSFAPSFTLSIGGAHLRMAIMDFNEDLNLDLVASSGSIVVNLLGDGAGSLSYLSDIYTPYEPSDMVVLDFNNDGHQDLTTINQPNNLGMIYMGNGTGTYSTATSFVLPNSSNSLTSADVNNDGNTDLITTSSTSSVISVFLGDGTSSVSLPMSSTTISGQREVFPMDFDQDGYIDLASLDNGLTLLKGNGSGSFSMVGTYVASAIPNVRSINGGDVNNDGNTDLVISEFYSNTFQVVLSQGNGLFSGNPFNPVFNIPNAFVSGDFNNDGKKDVIVSAEAPYGMSVLLGTSTASLVAAGTFTLNKRPLFIETGDFNNDNNLDLISANDTANDVSVFIGTGSGSFLAPLSYSVDYRPRALVVSDFDNDGNQDIATCNNGGMSINVLMGSGTGSFSVPLTYTLSLAPFCIHAGDFNNDNIQDFVVAGTGYTAKNYAIFIGTGTGTFTKTEYNYGSYLTPYDISVGDLNNDGNQDLVFVSYLSTSDVSVLMGNGLGTFSLTTTFTNVSTPKSVVVDDVTNDGNKDVIVVNSFSQGELFIFPGLGNGSFSPSISFLTVSWPTSVLSDDFNSDGSKDLAVLSGNVSVFLNTTAVISSIASLSICPGGQLVMNAAVPDMNYIWQPGGITTQSLVVATPGTYSVTLSNANGSCSSTSKAFTITINSALSPTLTVVNSSGVACLGTSAYLAATGATTYTWSTGSTTSSINVSPVASAIYTVTGTDLNNCSNTQTVSVTVDNTCADVWPGDANSDGTADNLDVLELGLHYTQTGTPRTSTSNSWQSYVATNWAGTITSGQNLNHSDCNGDGIIDANDTIAIYLNYGLTHAFKPSQQTSTNEQLTIVPDQPMVSKGQWGTASVYLGTSANPISTINGLAFTLHFDQSLIEPNSMQIDYPVSFLNTGQNLNFRKQDYFNGALYAATTHTNNSNINGYGKIAIIHYQIKSSLVHDTVLAFKLVQATQSSANGSLVPLTSGSASVTAIGSTVGINELSDNNMVAIYPNPANQFLVITSTQELQKVELLSVTGQLIISESASGNQHQLDVSSVSNGVYVVSVYGKNNSIQRKKIVVQH